MKSAKNKVTTVKQIDTARPGRHTTDVPNLSLLVKDSGAKSWVFRYSKNKKSREIGLGPYPSTTKAQASEAAREMKSRIQRGLPPVAETQTTRMTFEEAFETFWQLKCSSLTNAKHKYQWISTIQNYVFPVIRELSAGEVTTQNLVDILQPIWVSKYDTATKVRGRIEQILDFANITENPSGTLYANPARYKGHLEYILPKPSSVKRHLSCLPYKDGPDFMKDIRAREGAGARVFEFTILTAVRKTMALGCRTEEIDFANGLWHIPGSRNKTKLPFTVALSKQALSLLDPKRVGLQFHSINRPERQMSDPMRALLRKMGRTDITPHGFRSTFRDWAGETTDHEREVIEKALGHLIKNKAEAAYARGDMIDKRRILMQDWADYLDRRG